MKRYGFIKVTLFDEMTVSKKYAGTALINVDEIVTIVCKGPESSRIILRNYDSPLYVAEGERELQLKINGAKEVMSNGRD